AAEAYTRPGNPRGCMVIHAAQNCAAENADVAADLAGIRSRMERLVLQRLEEGVKAGELAGGERPDELAAFFATVMQGMSMKARDGATREALERVATLAMRAWPGVRQEP
ncbi:MAG: TetR family transcriptional regulator C-terminal domain-containing protein, partial [Hyphomonas sp.]|nr:TetR family transcriptional regulator C-terminal domain-containing protein [Hyphomonas sp.]